MLTNDDAALRNKRFGSSAFLIDIKPGIGVHDFHGHIRHDGTDAEEESGVAGNDLSVVVSADITDLHIAVGIEGIGLLLGGEGSVAEHFSQLHAGHDAGHIAGLIHLGECVLEIVKAGKRGEVASHGDEGHIGYSSAASAM